MREPHASKREIHAPEKDYSQKRGVKIFGKFQIKNSHTEKPVNPVLSASRLRD